MAHSSAEKRDLRIRQATLADESAILALVPRLVAFGPPPWREPTSMSATDRKVIGGALRSAGEDDRTILVATLAGADGIAAFIHLRSVVDYYTERRHGHVADIVVAENCEGHGIATRLLEAAEDWARAQGYEWLTIGVFQENARAARLYERMGFRNDIVHMLKPLP